MPGDTVEDEAHRKEPVVRRHKQKIDKVYLATTETPDGEDVYTMTGVDGQALPLVALDDRNLETLRQYAELMSARTGKPVRIIAFTKRTYHEIFPAHATGDNK